MVLQVIAGYDRLDLQSVDYPVPDYAAAIGAPVAQFRLGISPQFYDGLEPDVAGAIEAANAVLGKMTKGTKEIEMPSILGTGANSEGGLYRENLGSGFVRAETENAGAGGGGAMAADAVDPAPSTTSTSGARCDWCAAWWTMEVFRKQEVDLIVTPTIREVAVEHRRGTDAGGQRRARAIPSRAIRARWTITDCPPSPCLAGFRRAACRSGCRSAARTGGRRMFWRWRTPTKKRPIGTPAVRR